MRWENTEASQEESIPVSRSNNDDGAVEGDVAASRRIRSWWWQWLERSVDVVKVCREDEMRLIFGADKIRLIKEMERAAGLGYKVEMNLGLEMKIGKGVFFLSILHKTT